ncbi:MAG: hypothetical protein IT462_10635 [Planctomycetes bacterium]|nr:hypothetical protein [Planctomycetota bacterium]
MSTGENPQLPALDQKALDKMTQRYAKPGASGAETARLLMERYTRKRQLMQDFENLLRAQAGEVDNAELQKLRDAGLTDAEIDGMIQRYHANP